MWRRRRGNTRDISLCIAKIQIKESAEGREIGCSRGGRKQKQGKLLSLASGELFPASAPERVPARWLSPYFYRFFAAGCRASVRTRVAVHPGPPGVRSEAT